MTTSMRQKIRGFTIVELLIVIVVIAVLAVVAVVAYNGMQSRAQFTRLNSELGLINKALALYHAENGAYPVTGTFGAPGWRYSCATGITNFITGISAHISTIPQAPCNGGATNNDTWLYASDGAGYKLLHIRPNASLSGQPPVAMRDTRYTAASPSYGYWTPSWAAQ